MLTPGETARWSRDLGIAETHVRVDHLLSHVLWAVARLGADDVVFLGGTALCRTHLTLAPWSRVSEDLDLLVVEDLRGTRQRYEEGVLGLLRREFPEAIWLVAPSSVRPPAPAMLAAGPSRVRVQLLPAAAEWAAWRRVPVERRAVALRYADTPGAVELSVPTREGFAAMKLTAWEDRWTPRDLFDLAGLAAIGAITPGAIAVFTQLCGRPPDSLAYRELPSSTAEQWEAQLLHQTRELPDAMLCLSLVAHAVGRSLQG